MQSVEPLQGTIDACAFGGDGILRHQGKVIFVPFTLPKEEVLVKIKQSKKSFSRGALIKVLNKSPRRIDPLCRYFGQCGGCQLQHMDYSLQLELKTLWVKEALERIGHIKTPVNPAIGATEIWNYRRHIRLHIQNGQVGYHAADSNQLVPIEKCLIYSQETLPQLDTKKSEITLFKKPLSFQIENLTFYYHEDAFVQANEEQSKKLYLDLKHRILQNKPQKLLDLYCGIGATSLLLAQEGIEVIGLEGNKKAIEMAQKNALFNQIQCQFETANVDTRINHFLRLQKPEIVLVNPPRTGLNPPVIQALIEHKPKRIFYISCMPSTLARDLKLLTKSGYQVTYCQPYDMFPQTTHVETLVELNACG